MDWFQHIENFLDIYKIHPPCSCRAGDVLKTAATLRPDFVLLDGAGKIDYLLLLSPHPSLPRCLFRYVYELEASTGGGTGVSDKYVIQTPVSCPTGIQPPHNVTVSGPHSISLAWTAPGE